MLLSSIFGLHFEWYYVVNWLLLFISGVVVYFIIKNAFPNKPWLALPAALIYLVYPVNYARTWLVIINNTYALLLALLSILLLLLFEKTGKIHQILLANLLFLISLGTYEAGFGVVILSALLLLILTRKKRRWAFISILVVGVSFFVWRVFLQSGLLNVQDQYLQNVNPSILTVIKNYIQGLFIFLFNWVGPMLIPFGDYKYWVFIGLCLVAIVILSVLVVKRSKKLKIDSPDMFTRKLTEIKSLLKISVVGGLFWIAGYIPVIFLWQPTFYGDSSRVNFAAILGAALGIAALMAAGITFFSRRAEVPKRELLIAIIPLVILGMAYQVHSQNQRIKVWEINKHFWQEMFTTAANLKSGTKLIVVIPGYQELAPFEMLPFRGDWEAESALDVLYNNPDFFAEYYYLDNPGLADNWVPVSGDYSKFLFVYFDPESTSLSIIEDPSTALNLNITVESYDPESRMIDYSPEVGEYRWLVE